VETAGFDDEEIQGTNGYLLGRFLKSSSNHDHDYGRSIDNRSRLMLKVTRTIAGTIGVEHTGIRVSPLTPANA